MNWTAMAALAQFAAAAAVLITLVYLARQIRQSNRQDLLSAFRHTYDSLNRWAVAVFESEAVSVIVLRGRESYEGLSDTDRFRFDHVHAVLLNIIESHYYQVQQTALDDTYRELAMENLEEIIRAYLDNPGGRQLWENVQRFYEPGMRELVAKSIGDA